MSDWMSISSFHDAVKAKSEEEWRQIIVRSLKENVVDGIVMPTYPPDSLQVGIHGHSGEHSLYESWTYFQEVKNYADFAGHPIRDGRRLLDFGCGWGRISRAWMRSISPADIYAAEPRSELAVIARSCNPYINILKSEYLPPLPLANETIDYIVAFSVFSHLDEFATKKWFEEFRRILRPGGLIAVTTQRRDFIRTCNAMRDKKAQGEELGHIWLDLLAESFVDGEKAETAYDNGDFLYAPTSGTIPHPAARYGETIISPAYIQKSLSNGLDFIDLVDDASRMPQALIVMQKPR